MILGPLELALKGEAGFGPVEMGRPDLPRSGIQGKTSRLRCLTVSEDSGFLEFRMCERKEVWKSKEGGVKDIRRIDFNSLVNEESLRFLKQWSEMV